MNENVDFLKKVEASRREHLVDFVTALVFALIFVVLGLCLMGIWGNDSSLNPYLRYSLLVLGALFFLLIAPLCLRKAFKIRQHYLDYFYQTVTPALTKGEYRSFSFIRRPERKMLTMPLRKVLSCTPELDGDSFFKGEVEGASFYSFGYSYVAKVGDKTFEAEGRYIEFTLHNSFPFELIIKDRRSSSYYKKKPLLLRLKSDSPSFDEIHDVTADEEVPGLNLLSPFLVQGINCLNARYKAKLSAHIDGNKVQVYVDDCPRRYHASLFEELTPTLFAHLKEEALLPYAVYLGLGLDSSFYSI
jgi:hypothetical protein